VLPLLRPPSDATTVAMAVAVLAAHPQAAAQVPIALVKRGRDPWPDPSPPSTSQALEAELRSFSTSDADEEEDGGLVGFQRLVAALVGTALENADLAEVGMRRCDRLPPAWLSRRVLEQRGIAVLVQLLNAETRGRDRQTG
jgi:hypothetical protein